MITKEQMELFETFGFLVLRQAFSPEEMEKIISDFDSMIEKEMLRFEKLGEGSRGPKVFGTDGFGEFIEKHPSLANLAEDDRIYETIEQLLGPGFIWTGSEGVCGRSLAPWHADRQGKIELNFMTIKVHLYLDPTTKESCALRVIPGSHRSPFHEILKPIFSSKNNPDAQPYGVVGKEVPYYPFESNPGDVIFFNQCLLHSVYGNLENERRYIALKFGERIKNDDDIATLLRYKSDGIIFRPHKAFINSDSARIRGMVKSLVEHGEKV